ncbi:hypothetical protein [Lutibaculum baratangense]|uniref:hypothetical protein n=1 Tax=Lutibaculum baratangense TaxID=1358440 RepID=UPI001FCB571A|nr:hypothetical protein [Lutibaculum baratangense]
MAYGEMQMALAVDEDADPWHVCFVVGLAWGRLARLEENFVAASIDFLQTGSRSSLITAQMFHYERGPLPIEQSLSGGRNLFAKVILPAGLPDDLQKLGRAQERWMPPILSKDRPRYIGSWNATAMFMTALFAKPALASTMTTAEIALPPGGPIFSALKILHEAGLLVRKPEGSELDDAAFEPGAIYVNTGLMADLVVGISDCSMIDMHSGLYMLGTRLPESDTWF